MSDDPRDATNSAIRVMPKDGGYQLSWSDDPLDFIWQSSAQMDDLIARMNEAFAQGEAK